MDNYDYKLDPPTDELWESATDRVNDMDDRKVLLEASRMCEASYNKALAELRIRLTEAIYENWRYGDE